MKFIYKTFLFSCTLFLLMGCEENWLETKPESFFSPDNAFTTPEGVDAVLLTARKTLRDADWGNACHIRTEYYWTDISYGSLQNSGFPRDANISLTPFADAFQVWTRNYWGDAYKVIKDMNLVINRLNLSNFDDDVKKALLGEAYFHRAYWYYRLVHRFGDVPFTGTEITEPRLNYYTHSRETILNKIKEDMELAVQWLPEKVAGGKVNQAAGNHLLAKICLSVGDFDGAIAATSRVIDGGYELMKERFGSALYSDDPDYDVMWDLHQSDNMVSAANTEVILVAIDEYETQGNSGNGSYSNRYWMPLWWSMPDCEYNMGNGEDEEEAQLARAVSWARPNNFFNYTMKAEDPNDLRYSEKNWWSLDDYWYNKPGTSRYGQKINIHDQGIDSISRMFEFPYYKLNAPRSTPPPTINQGGFKNFYVYRLAETYLLRAEAYWWKGDLENAAIDINALRARAHASQKAPSDITIDYIMNERARELYTEEPRWTELARVSYTMALLNRDGYSLATMHEKNYYYDKMRRTDDFLFSEIQYKDQVYRVSPFHVYWPVPQNAIDANSLGHINQNLGYTGSENNIPPKTKITEED